MNSTAAGWLQVALLVAALAACYVPLGNYMARIFGGYGPSGSGVSPGGTGSPRARSSTAKEHWRVQRGIYKLCGVEREAGMRWGACGRSGLAVYGARTLLLSRLARIEHRL